MVLYIQQLNKMSYNNPNNSNSHLRPHAYNNSRRDDSDGDELSIEFLNQRSNTPLTQGTYNYHNTSTNSLNFQQPEPIYRNQTRTSLSDSYYDHPIFDTSQTQIQPPHDNPFTESYEMTDTSYQGNDHHYRTGQPNHLMNPTYNQAFIPHVYDEEDNDEQEYDQRIQYNQFQGIILIWQRLVMLMMKVKVSWTMSPLNVSYLKERKKKRKVRRVLKRTW